MAPSDDDDVAQVQADLNTIRTLALMIRTEAELRAYLADVPDPALRTAVETLLRQFTLFEPIDAADAS